MPNVDTKSGQLYYEVCDVVAPWVMQPQTIIFHHGVGANLHVWAPWIPVLASRYRIVRFDMRGFGRSVQPAPGFPWSFDVLIDDLLRIADAESLDRFHLVGESIGGTAAIACALRTPQRLHSLTLSNAAARGGLVSNVKGWRNIVAEAGQSAWARQMMQWRFHRDALPLEIYSWYLAVHESCSIDASFGLADLLLATDLTARLGEIRMPTLLLSPDASPFIPAQAMAGMHALIVGSELQVFAHSKHGLPLSHGEVCARVLLEFLERRCGRG